VACIPDQGIGTGRGKVQWPHISYTSSTCTSTLLVFPHPEDPAHQLRRVQSPKCGLCRLHSQSSAPQTRAPGPNHTRLPPGRCVERRRKRPG
jgi:hypothetical protein